MPTSRIKGKGVVTTDGNGGGDGLSEWYIEYTALVEGDTLGVNKATGPLWSYNTSDAGGHGQEPTYDWTNADFKTNGGTQLKIETTGLPVISTTTTSNDTCKFTIKVSVYKWGTENVQMDLNVNDIVTVT